MLMSRNQAVLPKENHTGLPGINSRPGALQHQSQSHGLRAQTANQHSCHVQRLQPRPASVGHHMRAGSPQRRVSETLGTELCGGPVTAFGAGRFSPEWSRPLVALAEPSRAPSGPGTQLGPPSRRGPTRAASASPPDKEAVTGTSGSHVGSGGLWRPYPDPDGAHAFSAHSQCPLHAPRTQKGNPAAGLMWPAQPAWFSLLVGVSVPAATSDAQF